MAQDSNKNQHGQVTTTNPKGVSSTKVVPLVVVDGKVVPDSSSQEVGVIN